MIFYQKWIKKFSEDQEHRKRLLEDHAHLESTVTNINTELENEKEKTRKTLKLAYLLRLEIAKVGFRKYSFFSKLDSDWASPRSQ